jgi:hypothetical protein
VKRNRYPEEVLDEDSDNGTMVESLQALREAVIGRSIVSAEQVRTDRGFVEATYLTLDDGRRVRLVGQGDCCAYTEVEAFLLNPELVGNMILGVGTTGGYDTWHVFADAGDVLQLTVGWSCGNPFYYSYGFDITVEDAPS